MPERLKNLEKKRENEAAERKERDRQVLIKSFCFFKSLFDPFWFQVRERLELLRQQAAAAALEVPKAYLLDYCLIAASI